MRAPALLVLALLGAAPARADDAMTAAVGAFYSASAQAGAEGGIPDSTMRIRLQPLLSPRLNQALANAATAEARFKSRNKDSPPLIEGDIFSSLFEGPTAWKIGACVGDAKAARCAVSLTRQDKGQKPANWIDTVVLTNIDGWKVDDVAYDANFAFGNTGTLSEMLNMTLSEAQ